MRRAQRHLSRTLVKGGKAPPKKSRKQKKKKDRPYQPDRVRSERRLHVLAKKAERQIQEPLPQTCVQRAGEPNQGKNHEKAKYTVRRLHKRIADIRKDTLHKATSQMVAKAKPPAERPKVIIIEELNVKGMLQNHKLAQAIADVGFSEFVRQLAYKCERLGIALYKAHPFFPSTQLCSGCHKMPLQQLDLSVRTYVCEHCKMLLDRDWNAAKNLVWLYTASLAEMDACGETVSRTVLALSAVSKKQEENTKADIA